MAIEFTGRNLYDVVEERWLSERGAREMVEDALRLLRREVEELLGRIDARDEASDDIRTSVQELRKLVS